MNEKTTKAELRQVDQLALPRRYEHPEKSRYYALWAQPDLFGQLCLMRAWGGIDSRKGRLISTPMLDVARCVVRMEEEDERRRSRGYAKRVDPPRPRL